VDVVKALLRFISYLFHGLLALGVLILACLSLVAGADSLRLGMLPWSGKTLVYCLFGAAAIGFFTLFLALRGSLRWLFFLWCLIVPAVLIKGYFLGPYRFSTGEATNAGYLVAGALVAVLGGWFQMTRSTRKHA
jgi:LPXTG-motif cell wall-anchored protein